jgi:hypothetical protein
MKGINMLSMGLLRPFLGLSGSFLKTVSAIYRACLGPGRPIAL